MTPTKPFPLIPTLHGRLEHMDHNRNFTARKTIYSGRTRFQDVAIIESHEFGKILLVDGCCQSTQLDEYIYHESLVHPALTALHSPRKVLVIGGGEGATLREILRHPSVERVVMVDIDAELVDLCERFLPEWHHGSFDDPRVDLILEDGTQFVASTQEQFDAIFIDICEPLAENADNVFSGDFYRAVKNRLSPHGNVVIQTQELPEYAHSDHVRVYRKINQIFAHVDSYRSYMPSFLSVWSFIIANDHNRVAGRNTDEIDGALVHRRMNKKLRYYDGETHRHMFSLTKDFRELLSSGDARK